MKNGNVIDMTDRIREPDAVARLKQLKVRLDLEHAKVALSTSLLSIVILVTLANNSLMKSVSGDESSTGGGRGIASVSSTIDESEGSRQLVQDLAARDLSAAAKVGRKPSAIEKLAFEVLEGKYAVRLDDGKISEIEFSNSTDLPKPVGALMAFLESHRDLMPADFAKRVKVDRQDEGSQTTETYQLVNNLSMPVAKVLLRMDNAGRVLAMRVSPAQVAAAK